MADPDRKTALATAGAVALGAVTAALAIGANFGLFGLTGNAAERQEFTPASSEQETTTTTALEPVIETRVVDVPVDDNNSSGSSGPARGPRMDTNGPGENSGPGSTSSGHHRHHDDDDDDRDEDDHDDDDDDHGRNRGPGGGDDDDDDEDDD